MKLDDKEAKDIAIKKEQDKLSAQLKQRIIFAEKEIIPWIDSNCRSVAGTSEDQCLIMRLSLYRQSELPNAFVFENRLCAINHAHCCNLKSHEYFIASSDSRFFVLVDDAVLIARAIESFGLVVKIKSSDSETWIAACW